MRPVALLLVLFSVAGAGTAAMQPPPEPGAAVLLDFSSSIPENFWKTLQTELRQTDIEGLPNESTLWVRRERFYEDMQAGDIFQVHLTGDCGMGMEFDRATRGPLGWVYQVDGKILPFVFVDCDRIARALWPELRGQTPAIRRQKLARAISHVIAHEITHIVTQDAGHRARGVQKAHLSAAELADAWSHATLVASDGKDAPHQREAHQSLGLAAPSR